MSESADRLFGDLAVRLNILTAAQLEREQRLRTEKAPAMSLQEWLLRRDLINAEQCATMSRVFAAERKSRKPTDVSRALHFGAYRVISELGRGGMGVVYRALDTRSNREVALKTLRVGEDTPGQSVERFLREANTAASLQHPGIVPIYEIGVHDGAPWYAMQLVVGRPFDQILKDGALPERHQRVRIVQQVASAIGHAHSRRIIHRDLKPHNVLIDERGDAHVMDLGLAKSLDDQNKLTGTSEVLGTPKYLAPEQLDGVRDRSGPVSDVYALGVMLYEAVCNRPPFTGSGLTELLTQILKGNPTPPRQHDPTIAEDLEFVILKSIRRDSTLRYPDANALAEALLLHLEGKPQPREAAANGGGTLSKWMGRLLGR